MVRISRYSGDWRSLRWWTRHGLRAKKNKALKASFEDVSNYYITDHEKHQQIKQI